MGSAPNKSGGPPKTSHKEIDFSLTLVQQPTGVKLKNLHFQTFFMQRSKGFLLWQFKSLLLWNRLSAHGIDPILHSFTEGIIPPCFGMGNLTATAATNPQRPGFCPKLIPVELLTTIREFTLPHPNAPAVLAPIFSVDLEKTLEKTSFLSHSSRREAVRPRI